MSKAVSIFLLVLFVLVAAVAGFAGLMLSMASDPCGSATDCSYGMIGWGVLIASAGQVVVVVAFGTWTVVRLVRDRTAWWVPILGVVAVAGVLSLGAVLAFQGADIS